MDCEEKLGKYWKKDYKKDEELYDEKEIKEYVKKNGDPLFMCKLEEWLKSNTKENAKGWNSISLRGYFVGAVLRNVISDRATGKDTWNIEIANISIPKAAQRAGIGTKF